MMLAIGARLKVWCWGENSGQKLNVQSTSNYVYARACRIFRIQFRRLKLQWGVITSASSMRPRTFTAGSQNNYDGWDLVILRVMFAHR